MYLIINNIYMSYKKRLDKIEENYILNNDDRKEEFKNNYINYQTQKTINEVTSTLTNDYRDDYINMGDEIKQTHFELDELFDSLYKNIDNNIKKINDFSNKMIKIDEDYKYAERILNNHINNKNASYGLYYDSKQNYIIELSSIIILFLTMITGGIVLQKNK